jgi:hypothetical protein
MSVTKKLTKPLCGVATRVPFAELHGSEVSVGPPDGPPPTTLLGRLTELRVNLDGTNLQVKHFTSSLVPLAGLNQLAVPDTFTGGAMGGIMGVLTRFAGVELMSQFGFDLVSTLPFLDGPGATHTVRTPLCQ